MERDGGGVGGAQAATRPGAEAAWADLAEKLAVGDGRDGTAAAGGGGEERRMWSVGLRRQYRMPAALMAYPAAGASNPPPARHLIAVVASRRALCAPSTPHGPRAHKGALAWR